MSKKKGDAVKMVEVVALHDLSYIDHTGGSQYRRQGSRPFPMDEANAKHFADRKAVKIVTAVEPVEPVVDEFEDDGLGDEETANQNDGADEKANSNINRGNHGRRR